MPHSFHESLHHVVWSTKDWAPLIHQGEVETRLHDFIGGIIRERRFGGVLAIGGMPDHVHVLVDLHPSFALAEVIRTVKAVSSKWANAELADLIGARFAWQIGYGAFSVSHSVRDAVVAYIRNQAEHHTTMTFAEELEAFLKRHEIQVDPRDIG